MEARGTRCVIDATGMLLTKALPYHPFLVKPNLEELEEIVGKKLDGLSAIEIAAQQMQQLGARNVLVSLGGEGALLIDEKGHAHHHRAPKGKVPVSYTHLLYGPIYDVAGDLHFLNVPASGREETHALPLRRTFAQQLLRRCASGLLASQV